MALKTLLTYPGIDNITSWVYTRTPGISPNVCTIYATPQNGVFRQGNIDIYYGSVHIRIRDCIVDKADATISPRGERSQTITILDRRWRWKDTGKISGFYYAGEKTNRELAALCLKAMGEKRFNLTRMPNTAGPRVDWDYTNPADALRDLCDQAGCDIILQLDDVVVVMPINSGMALPNAAVLSDVISKDPAERPDALVVVGAPVRYQVDLELEPIANAVPIEELSYRPKDGKEGNAWANIDIVTFEQVDAKHRRTAIEQVFKRYRIKPTFKLPGSNKDYDIYETIILTEQVERYVDGNRKGLMVYGSWYNNLNDGVKEDGENGDEADEPQEKKDVINRLPIGTIYTGGFTFDAGSREMVFDDRVFLLEAVKAVGDEPAGNIISPPKLFVRTSVYLLEGDTNATIRSEFRAETPGNKLNTLPVYRIYDDLEVEVFRDTKKTIRSNIKEMQKLAKLKLGYLRKEYDIKEPRQLEYVGIVPWNCSGAIKQIQWQQDESGSTTVINRQVESYAIAPTAVELRKSQDSRRRSRNETTKHKKIPEKTNKKYKEKGEPFV
ncbi:MAG: hypothetical protein HN975_01980 [Anaerolineae bacterium]|jgi:hypothetical protein|nr:hypothetical protein [Anaerolineae bacterium]